MKGYAHLSWIPEHALGKALPEHGIKKTLNITTEEACNKSKVGFHFYTAVKALQ